MKKQKLIEILKLVLKLIVIVLIGYLVLAKQEIKIPVGQEKKNVSENNSKEKKSEKTANEEAKNDAAQEEKDKVKVFKNPFSFERINLGLDLAGGVSVVYEADRKPSIQEMESAISLLRTRLTYKGHTEAEVSAQGDTKIRVEMPGVDNPQEAVDEIGQTAELKFYGVTQENFTKLLQEGAKIEEIGELVVLGKNIKDATKQYSQVSQTSGTEPVVSLQFDSEGTKAFSNATQKYLNNYIAIVLDDDIISMPRVSTQIYDGVACITGMESDKSAETLANLIKAGSLPFKLRPVETSIIGARLGENALLTSIKAGLIGLALVVLFMICVYVFPGFISAVALGVYTILVMVVLACFDVTLTLPGIAGIILSIGMAVDANVIIFTRIREELRLGKTVVAAIESGFEKAKSAILDGNITTLLTAGILYWKGIGSIRGFAQTLAIGIAVSMFTSLVVTKSLLRTFVNLGIKSTRLYGVKVNKNASVEQLNKKHGKKEN